MNGSKPIMAKPLKILYIDPWCADGSELCYYTTGFVSSISEYSDITLICQYNTSLNNSHFKIKKFFFPWSAKLKVGRMRTLIRGAEYIAAYFLIGIMASVSRYDVIHIEWPLFYRVGNIDAKIFKTLKGKCRVFSLKAHNILPHSTGGRYVEVFRKIYSVPDIIFVHGENMRNEFYTYFPEYISKVKIQRHGRVNHNCTYDEEQIETTIKNKIEQYDRIYLLVGRIDYDKGFDRIIQIWNQKFLQTKNLLIVAGKISNEYDFSAAQEMMEKNINILFYSGYIKNNLLNYFFDKCDVVLLPYRAGAMSGVIFTAAEFSKPILATEFGCVGEYVVNGVNGFLVANDDESLGEAMEMIKMLSKEELHSFGVRLHEHILKTGSWNEIAKGFVDELRLCMFK